MDINRHGKLIRYLRAFLGYYMLQHRNAASRMNNHVKCASVLSGKPIGQECK